MSSSGFYPAEVRDVNESHRDLWLYSKIRFAGYGLMGVCLAVFFISLTSDLNDGTYPVSDHTWQSLMAFGAVLLVAELVEALFVMRLSLWLGLFTLVRDIGRPVFVLLLAQYIGASDPRPILNVFIPYFIFQTLRLVEQLVQLCMHRKGRIFDLDSRVIQILARSLSGGSERASKIMVFLYEVPLPMIILETYIAVLACLRLRDEQDGFDSFSWWWVLWPVYVGGCFTVGVTLGNICSMCTGRVRNPLLTALGALLTLLLNLPEILVPLNVAESSEEVSWGWALYPAVVSCVLAVLIAILLVFTSAAKAQNLADYDADETASDIDAMAATAQGDEAV